MQRPRACALFACALCLQQLQRMPTRIAIWDRPPAQVLATSLQEQDASFAIERHAPEVCTALAMKGKVDVALVPTYLALQGHDGFDAIPGIGLSSWQYPFARLVWKDGLSSFPETVAYPRTHVTERFVARVILHEHYGVDPSFTPVDTDDPASLHRSSADAGLLVGPQGAAYDAGEAFTMDLGREWYELTNYPMVWGLFVTKRGEATTSLVEALMAAGKQATEHRDDWITSAAPPQHLREFYTEDLRTGIGRLERASLTDFRTYLFYYNVSDEIPDMPFVSEDPDAAASEDADDADAQDANGASDASSPLTGVS